MDGIFGARGKGFHDVYMSVHPLEKQLVSKAGKAYPSSMKGPDPEMEVPPTCTTRHYNDFSLL